MARHRRRKKKENLSFWQSYSDMMAALLLVFVLLIAFTVSKTKDGYEEKEEKLMEQQTQLNEKNREMKAQNKEIENYQKKVQKQQQQLDQVVGIRSEIVKELNQEFKNSNLDMSIDSDTGAICLDSSVLFDYNKYTLKKDGIKFLNEFFPKYFDVILKDSVKDYIAEIIIEGHTDNHGSYLYNLDLSQKRAFAVVEYCLGDNNNMFKKKELEKIRKIVTANGRAYYELKYDSQHKVDEKASRRVEVKFRLTEEDMIEDISEILKK